MSFFLSNKFKEKLVSEAQKQQDVVLHKLPRATVVEQKLSSTFASGGASLTDRLASAFTFDIDLQGFVSVLCFLVLVAVLCGWFDRWVTHHRESEVSRRPTLEVQSRALNSFQTALEGESAMALFMSRETDLGVGLDRPQTEEEEGESARASADIMQAGIKGEKAADDTTGGESSLRNKARASTQIV